MNSGENVAYFFMKTKKILKYIWQDEKGAVTTVEIISYTMLIISIAVALICYCAAIHTPGRIIPEIHLAGLG
jgi:Flp pilus assembly pilin Flp